jgi:Methyltransferase domain
VTGAGEAYDALARGPNRKLCVNIGSGRASEKNSELANDGEDMINHSLIDRANAYVRKGKLLWRLATMDPVEASIRVRSEIAERLERRKPRYQQSPYVATDDWERRLHEVLGVFWPCQASAEFWPLWAEVLRPFEAKQVPIGRGAFGGWADGEPGMTRAAWCLIRHLQPAHVVETGVARGFTTRMILEGFERNGAGHLYSIDLPPTLRPDLHAQIGAAVRSDLRHRWSYIKGSSRRHLPGLLAELGQIDLFIHDSAHTEYNTHFELDRAWSALRPGGVVMADDIDYSSAFYNFMYARPGHQFLVYRAEPMEPDPIRFDAKGLIGIARKSNPTEFVHPV